MSYKDNSHPYVLYVDMNPNKLSEFMSSCEVSEGLKNFVNNMNISADHINVVTSCLLVLVQETTQNRVLACVNLLTTRLAVDQLNKFREYFNSLATKIKSFPDNIITSYRPASLDKLIETLDFIDEAVDTVSGMTNNAFRTFINQVLLTFCGFKLLGQEYVDYCIKFGLISYDEFKHAEHSSVPDLFKNFLKQVSIFIRRSLGLGLKLSNTVNSYQELNLVCAWLLHNEFNRKSDYDIAPEHDAAVKESEWLVKLNACDTFIQANTNPNKSESDTYRYNRLVITNLKLRVNSHHYKPRPKPYNIFISGPAGVGKTSVLCKILTAHIYKEMNIDIPTDNDGMSTFVDETTCTLNIADKFASNYRPSRHLTVIVDEIGAIEDKNLQNDSLMFQFNEVFGEGKFSLNRASVEEKGQVYLQPLVMMGVSNYIDGKITTIITDKKAVYRRFRLWINITIRSEYQLRGSVNWQRVYENQVNENLGYLNFEVGYYEGETKVLYCAKCMTPECKDHNDHNCSLSQLLDLISISVKGHLLSVERLKNTTGSVLSVLNHCDTCGNINLRCICSRGFYPSSRLEYLFPAVAGLATIYGLYELRKVRKNLEVTLNRLNTQTLPYIENATTVVAHTANEMRLKIGSVSYVIVEGAKYFLGLYALSKALPLISDFITGSYNRLFAPTSLDQNVYEPVAALMGRLNIYDRKKGAYDSGAHIQKSVLLSKMSQNLYMIVATCGNHSITTQVFFIEGNVALGVNHSLQHFTSGTWEITFYQANPIENDEGVISGYSVKHQVIHHGNQLSVSKFPGRDVAVIRFRVRAHMSLKAFMAKQISVPIGDRRPIAYVSHTALMDQDTPNKLLAVYGARDDDSLTSVYQSVTYEYQNSEIKTSGYATDDFNGFVGKCGAPCITKDGNNWSLSGIYSASSTTKGFFSLIDLRDYENALSKLIPEDFPVLSLPDIYEHEDVYQKLVPKSKNDVAFHLQTELGGVNYLGAMQDQGFGKMKSKVFHYDNAKSILDILGDEYKHELDIPRFDHVVSPSGQWLSPGHNAVRDMVTRVSSIDNSIMDACVEHFAQKLYKTGAFAADCELNVHMAVNGYPSSIVSGIPKNTSAGFPFSGKKSLYLEKEPHPIMPDAMILNDYMADRVKMLYDTYNRGERYGIFFKGCPKDEPRATSKIAQRKIRLFTLGPMDYLVVCKQLVGAWAEIFMRLGTKAESVGGVNCYSEQWGNIATEMSNYPSCFGGDFGKYDKTITAPMMHSGKNVILRVKQLCGLSEDHLRRVNACCSEFTDPFVIILRSILSPNGSVVSGMLLTFVFNCIVNSLLIRYCWVTIMKRPDESIDECLLRFDSNVMFMAGGDDNNTCVTADVREQFNFESVQRVLTSIGLNYTLPDKSAGSIKYKPISEATIYKRTWVWRDGWCFAPIEKASISKSITIAVASEVMDKRSQQLEALRGVWMELAQYGEEEYSRVVPSLSSLFGVVAPSFISIIEKIKDGSNPWTPQQTIDENWIPMSDRQFDTEMLPTKWQASSKIEFLQFVRDHCLNRVVYAVLDELYPPENRDVVYNMIYSDDPEEVDKTGWKSDSSSWSSFFGNAFASCVYDVKKWIYKVKQKPISAISSTSGLFLLTEIFNRANEYLVDSCGISPKVVYTVSTFGAVIWEELYKYCFPETAAVIGIVEAVRKPTIDNTYFQYILNRVLKVVGIPFDSNYCFHVSSPTWSLSKAFMRHAASNVPAVVGNLAAWYFDEAFHQDNNVNPTPYVSLFLLGAGVRMAFGCFEISEYGSEMNRFGSEKSIRP